MKWGTRKKKFCPSLGGLVGVGIVRGVSFEWSHIKALRSGHEEEFSSVTARCGYEKGRWRIISLRTQCRCVFNAN